MYFLNGTPPSKKLIKKFTSAEDMLITADGAYDYLRKYQIMPAVLIGDMDSISPDSLEWIESLDIEIVRYSTDKEHTDSELAVTHLSLHHDNFERIHILGLSGNRPDHVYGNYLLLSGRFENTSLFAFVDGYMIQAVTEGKHWFTATPNSLVSVFAIRRPARSDIISVVSGELLWVRTIAAHEPDFPGISRVLLAHIRDITCHQSWYGGGAGYRLWRYDQRGRGRGGAWCGRIPSR